MAVNQHSVLKGLDIYEKVGRGVAHDEYIPFTIDNNVIHVDGETLPFSGSIYVEFLKVSQINFFCILMAALGGYLIPLKVKCAR